MIKKIACLLVFICLLNVAKSQQATLLGLSGYGGNQFGTILSYKTGDTTTSSVFALTGNSGRYPTGNLIQATNGNLYGTTSTGGVYSLGTIFEYNYNLGTFIRKFDFNTLLGINPTGSLLQATDGNLYGMTNAGGIYGKGVIFQYNIITNTYTKKYDFDSANGCNPYSSLIQANDGYLYGMTHDGGANNVGVIFQYNITSNTYTKKVDLSSANGYNPGGRLLQASDGNIYGMTYYGGANNLGVIFQYNYTTNTYVKKMDLNNTIGSNPVGSLMQANNGNLYGMTYVGGSNNKGVIFEYNYSTNSYIKKFDFNTTNGYGPYGNLIQATDGNFYAMTVSGGTGGGTFGGGVIFQYNVNTNVYSKKYDFISSGGPGPQGSLMQAADGRLYGFTYSGGISGLGSIFQYNITNGTFTNKVDIEYAVNGSEPDGSLIQVDHNYFYGVTPNGGVNNAGVIFQYNFFTNEYIKKFDFTITSGYRPHSIIMGYDGDFYGMTVGGGTNGYGTIYKYNYHTDSLSKLFDFNNSNGSNPQGSLIQVSNGIFYGMTTYGGANGNGVIFQYNYMTKTYTKKFDFITANGANPYGNLIQVTDSNFYGMTKNGGLNGYGVIFKYNFYTNIFTKIFDFNNSNGANPQGSLIKASNGNLYGMAWYGGSNDQGIFFNYNIANNTYTKLLDFNGINGANPCNLMQAKDGIIYGMTGKGGNENVGIIFQYNPTTNVFTKKWI